MTAKISNVCIAQLRQIMEGGFKPQLQQLMFSSGFSEFHIEQQLAVNLYR